MSDYLDRTLQARLRGVLHPPVREGVLAVLFRLAPRPGTDRGSTKSPRGPHEVFYWVTILVSNTLGTALGDFGGAELGPRDSERGALVFGRPARPRPRRRTSSRPVQKERDLSGLRTSLTRPPRARPSATTLTKSRPEGGLGLKPHRLVARHRGVHRRRK